MVPLRRKRGQNWRRCPTARGPMSASTSATKARSSARRAACGGGGAPSSTSRKSHGRPSAPRASITAAAPASSRARAAARPSTSPEAITGTGTSAASARVTSWSARPRYSCAGRPRVDAERRGAGLDEARRHPAPRLVALAQPGAHLDGDRHVRAGGGAPRRATMAAARSGSASSAAPAPVLTTLRTGHAMLMSTRSAPASTRHGRGVGEHVRARRRTAGSRSGARRRGRPGSPACAGCGSARRRRRSSP